MRSIVWRNLKDVRRNEASVLGFANYTLYCEEIQIAERNPRVFYGYMPRIKDMMYELVYTAWKVNEYDEAVALQPKRRFWEFYKRRPKDIPEVPDYKGPTIEVVQDKMDFILDNLAAGNLRTILAIRPDLDVIAEVVKPGPRKNLDELV